MKLRVYEDSKNYTATIVMLPTPFPLQGLDNVVGVSIFGNTCIIPKSYPLDRPYVFFPSETQLSERYLKENNLYREGLLNSDPSKKAYFEPNGRVKAIKFKGNKSTGIVMPLQSLNVLGITDDIPVGSEFNEADGVEVCKKYVVPTKQGPGSMKIGKILDELIDSKMFPEHIDTSHLLKHIDTLNLSDEIVLTVKLHGTSERLGYALTKRKLSFKERIAKWFGVKVKTEEYQYVTGSRRVVKSIAFNELKNKSHFYDDDLWTRVAKEHFANKLYKGEMIYFEVIGKDYNGAAIQKGYTYGEITPVPYIYRISHINSQGIEVDLTWSQLKERAAELGVHVVPTMYKGILASFLYHWVKLGPDVLKLDNSVNWKGELEKYLRETYLDKPSILDPSAIEEGICLRVERYPRPVTYKLKSPLFLIHESGLADKEISNLEEEN